MSCEFKEERYAHAEGHLDLTYNEDGRYLLTCGPDGDVRVYDGFDDDDPISQQVGDVAYSLAYKNDRFYAGSDDNSIQAYMLDSKEPDGLVTRFMAPVTHMCFNASGKMLIAGSNDFTIKIVDVDTKKQQVLTGHDAPILSVALEPSKEQLVASSSCDGTVRIWQIEDQKCIHTIPGLAKNNDFLTAPSLVRLTWNRDGKHLVIPFSTEIRIYDTTSWQISFILNDTSITENVSMVSFSPCWNYLAAACKNGAFVIWDFAARKVVTRMKHRKGHSITAISWNPKNNKELAYCDNNGQLGLLVNVMPSGVSTKSSEVSASSESVALANPVADLFDDDDDDMLIEATRGNKEAVEDDQPAINNDNDEDDDDEVDIGALKRKFMKIDEDSNDTNMTSGGKEGDLESVTSEKPQVPLIPQPPAFEPTPLQPPFLSTSTPVHLSHRFMVWNSVGIIIQYNTDEENSINIEFHDTAVHHALHVTNTLNHTMAALSLEAVLLACTSDEDKPSKLVCMHYSSWDTNKEWTVDMPQGEDIRVLCLGEGWAAVGTDRRQVRLFTVGGVQKEVISIPGPIVTLAGYGQQLMVVYHSGSGIPGDQCLGIKLITMARKKWTMTINGDMIPLSPKSTLTFVGFSAEGTPFIMDSMGIVRMMSRNHGNSWMQVANLKGLCKGKSDNYWICGIHENPQQIRAVLCKGSRFPPTLPRPMVQILQYELPLCDMTSDKGLFEEGFWKTKLLSQHLEWWDSQGFEVEDSAKEQALMPQQESLMKMFALACKSERELRAMELCQLMPNQRTVQLAIKYASRLRMIQLAQKLNDVAREKAEEEALEAQRALMRANQGLEVDDEDEELNSYHNHLHQQRLQQQQQNGGEQDDEEREEEMEEEIEEEEGDAGEENDEEQENKVVLKFGSNKSAEPKQKSLCSSQKERKNPFKVQKLNSSAGKGSSVFDSMEKPKAKSGGNNNKSEIIKNKKITFSKSSGSKQKKLFCDDAKKRKRSDEIAEDESHGVTDGAQVETKSSKMSKTESKDTMLSENTSLKLKGFSFGK